MLEAYDSNSKLSGLDITLGVMAIVFPNSNSMVAKTIRQQKQRDRQDRRRERLARQK